MKSLLASIKAELRKTIVGQDEIIRLLLVSVAAGGHSLIEGVPGLAKTLLVNSLAKVLGLSFNRIQFTPDLVPSDITGTEVLDTQAGGERMFRFVQGPIFSHMILADEINRTPPKTQSALLQAMQEQAVTILGKTYALPQPFFVFATQNPIEYEGTYPLPEAQLDRFLMHIEIRYPSLEEELQIMDADASSIGSIQSVASHEAIVQLLKAARNQPVSDKVKAYVVDLVRNTRPESALLEKVKRYVLWGAGPRAAQMLLRAAQANALIDGRSLVEKEDVDRLLRPVLQHRMVLNYQAMDGLTAGLLLEEVKKDCEGRL